jgi:hypothetical protein
LKHRSAFGHWFKDVRVLLRAHRESIGRWPNPLLPRTFNERLLHRLLVRRSPLDVLLNDKLAFRDFVEQRAGAGHCVPLLHVTEDPHGIPWDSFDGPVIVKPSHGSGWYRVVRDPARVDREAAAAEFARWLGTSYHEVSREWAYRDIPRRLLVEPLLPAPPGDIEPCDHKAYLFSGRLFCVLVRRTDPEGVWHSALYDPAGRPLPCSYNRRPREAMAPPPQAFLDQLAALGAKVAAGVDFVALDAFIDAGTGRPLLHEFTVFPTRGTGVFDPPWADRWFGDAWAAGVRGAPFPPPPV